MASEPKILDLASARAGSNPSKGLDYWRSCSTRRERRFEECPREFPRQASELYGGDEAAGISSAHWTPSLAPEFASPAQTARERIFPYVKSPENDCSGQAPLLRPPSLPPALATCV